MEPICIQWATQQEFPLASLRLTLTYRLLCLILVSSGVMGCGKTITAVPSQRVTLSERHDESKGGAQAPREPSDTPIGGSEIEEGSVDQGERDALIVDLDMGAEGGAMTTDASLTEGSPSSPDAEPSACEPWANEACARWRRFGEGERGLAPIMLVHGFFGWGDDHAFDYFYGIPQLLHAHGYRVLIAELDPINSSELRSEQLASQVDEALTCTCSERLNIIAHSQGGLDARYLLGPLERAHLIESLTTISTPHRGFELAGQGARGDEVGLEFVEMLTALSSELIRGNPERPHDLPATLRSMSIEARQAYDEAWPDPSHIPIYSFAGITNPLADGGEVCDQGERPAPSRGDLIEPALVASYWMLGGFDIPNDGVVPASSCVWGRFLGCIASDHFDQVGQIFGVSDFDHENFYLNHARFLEEQGH